MLQGTDVDYKIIDYLKTPFTTGKLDAICKGLNLEPLELIRTGDELFKELRLSKKDERSRKEWLQLMSDNPGLIQRPIVEYNGKYAMGRPPESITSILN